MIGFLLLMAVLFLKGTKIQSVDEYYLTHMEDIQEDSETVTISIRCDTLRKPENWKKLKKQLQDEKYVPEDGVILDEMTCVLRKWVPFSISSNGHAATIRSRWNTTDRTPTYTVPL